MHIPVVILAAGASRRLGQPKQLVELKGETLLHRLARAACSVTEPVLVVLGCEADRMRQALGDLPVTCVRNLDWEEGMASSLRAAASALPLDARAALFLVCDQPRVDADLLTRMLALHEAHPDRRIACAYAATRGIPAVLPRRDFDRLLGLQGDQGAKPLLKDPDVLLVDFPEGAWDVDLPEDLAQLEP